MDEVTKSSSAQHGGVGVDPLALTPPVGGDSMCSQRDFEVLIALYNMTAALLHDSTAGPYNQRKVMREAKALIDRIRESPSPAVSHV